MFRYCQEPGNNMAVHASTFQLGLPPYAPKEVWRIKDKVGYKGNACVVIVAPQITDYATSVVLHYYSATDPTAQVRGFLVSCLLKSA